MKSVKVLLIYSSFRKDEFAKTTNFRDIFSFVVPKQHSSMANQEQLNTKHLFFQLKCSRDEYHPSDP